MSKKSSLYNPLFLIWLGTVACQSPHEKQQTLGEKVVFSETNPPGESPEGMVWIPGGTFRMGTDDQAAYSPEKPAVSQRVEGFWMDEHEVSNQEFEEFTKATGYITVAERKPEWEEIKSQLPPGTPKPPDSVFVAGSLVFSPPSQAVPLQDISRWWKWVAGASWKHPEGPGSNLDGKADHPVVHIAYEDAEAYAQWVGKRLPSEKEWEFAARDGINGKRFAWGDELTPDGRHLANTFQGKFPHQNTAQDGFLGTAPIKSFPPNSFGLYDMIGNVWELTSDWYDALKFVRLAGQAPKLDASMNPCYNPNNPYAKERVIKGGSYLCAEDYCVNYRPSARQGQAYDSGTSNVGFRLVKDAGN